ncbi:hypothetical protein HCN44_011275 [Aphidius gifuensis]|uniref:Gamma-aminobutyric acid type B receptor subunit 2 n=1 Tax=Aphidius gifuensis TaxID=684658 RepID=A0A834XZZ6_APHGI|nr:uncharacterized protein LOC122851373 [Aphidius gifuensis]KAF7994006.1 hypothetical protein HCN44_011275 [Aphidius gifuensis]
MWKYRATIGLLIILSIFQSTNSNRCLTMLDETGPKRSIYYNNQILDILLELNERPTQRIVTKITKIYLTEVLGYTNIKFINYKDDFNIDSSLRRLSDIYTIQKNKQKIPYSMINMEVWVPPQFNKISELNNYDIKSCGSLVSSPGRFGWFIPKILSDSNDNSYVFNNHEKASKFDINNTTFDRIKNLTINKITNDFFCQSSKCNNGIYIPKQCELKTCGLLLASNYEATHNVIKQIDDNELYVKVAWFGKNIGKVIKILMPEYEKYNNDNEKKKSFVILHWTPSDIITNENEFIQIKFSQCQNDIKYDNYNCLYDKNKLSKIVWSKLETIGTHLINVIKNINFNSSIYDVLKIDNVNNNSEDDIACNWMINNLNYTINNWTPSDVNKEKIYVGGIFPMTSKLFSDNTIVIGARMAKEKINSNSTLLMNYNIELVARDGHCKSDTVMKSFIDYIIYNSYDKFIGLLGPGCSDTIEPLVGVSKYYNTAIISYGAEGSSFHDRKRYPYFFRTIPENKQYGHVYVKLFQKFKWQRVAALSEDGQIYSEHISYMQDIFRNNGIHFIATTKYSKNSENFNITMYLEDLKTNRARIILADINNEVIVRQIMCEAYHLEMTMYQGYVWFLPLWIQKDWYSDDENYDFSRNTSCTIAQMNEAVNGHFSVSHEFFASDNTIMQEGKTVRQWRDEYEHQVKQSSNNIGKPSNYAGYAYDAMWTYAYAVDRLIKENNGYISDYHTEPIVKQLTSIIAETDFQGVSGRIKFYGGASRFSDSIIVQRINGKINNIGNFYPNISEITSDVIDGKLVLNESAIIWLSNVIPNDGSVAPIVCVLPGLSSLLNVSCESAIIIACIILFIIITSGGIILFIMFKRKYDKEVRMKEKAMVTMDMVMRRPVLDKKWEIPRSCTSINRIIGEGEFGRVYGGLVDLTDGTGCRDAAIKVLKEGSSSSSQMDFFSELEYMKLFNHKNIVKLLGVLTVSSPEYIILEFMLYGDLKNYLLSRRGLVYDDNYNNDDKNEVSPMSLTGFALDIARALSYLAELKFIHRDIAARNCLISSKRVAKLADFGLARPMYDSDYYKILKTRSLPVRWMSPESLKTGNSTPASDIWAYGILLWEIITFGNFPYSKIRTEDVVKYVTNGNTLDVPKNAKPELKNLIKSCWSYNAKDRKRAPYIVDILARNPNIVTPCIDSVTTNIPLVNTNTLDFPLPEKDFSMNLQWGAVPLCSTASQAPSTASTSSVASTTLTQLQSYAAFNSRDIHNNSAILDMNYSDNYNSDIYELQNNELHESAKPLLNNLTNNVLKIQQCVNGTIRNNIPSYVNCQDNNNINNNLFVKNNDINNTT